MPKGDDLERRGGEIRGGMLASVRMDLFCEPMDLGIGGGGRMGEERKENKSTNEPRVDKARL